MRFLTLFTLLASGLFSYSQDLNGIWQGTMSQSPGGCFSQYKVELQINYIATANTMSGKAYDYYDSSLFVKHDFSGRFNSSTKRMVIIENNLMQSKIPASCVPCIKTFDLTWTKSGNDEILTGEAKGREFGSYKDCPSYKVTLRRAAKSDFVTDVEQSAELLALQQKLALKPREKVVAQTITLDTSVVTISLYDNAQVDNDTVTVLLNNKLLLYKQRLTEKPLTISLNAFPGTEYELLMYADNLGSIPPNTALLVVRNGKKKYDVFVSSSEQKSAVVRFRYK